MLKSKSHPEIILHKWISRNSKLKTPLEHPLSESLEGKEQGQPLNRYLSKVKASFTLPLTFCLRKHLACGR